MVAKAYNFTKLRSNKCDKFAQLSIGIKSYLNIVDYRQPITYIYSNKHKIII